MSEDWTASYRKFQTSKQEPLRLSIALDGFFRPEPSPEAHEAYGQYLRRRLQPAVSLLIDADDAYRLAVLAEQGWFTARQTDDFIKLAREKKKTAAFVWLLRWKGDKYGFRDKDFSL